MLEQRISTLSWDTRHPAPKHDAGAPTSTPNPETRRRAPALDAPCADTTHWRCHVSARPHPHSDVLTWPPRSTAALAALAKTTPTSGSQDSGPSHAPALATPPPAIQDVDVDLSARQTRPRPCDFHIEFPGLPPYSTMRPRHPHLDADLRDSEFFRLTIFVGSPLHAALVKAQPLLCISGIRRPTHNAETPSSQPPPCSCNPRAASIASSSLERALATSTPLWPARRNDLDSALDAELPHLPPRRRARHLRVSHPSLPATSPARHTSPFERERARSAPSKPHRTPNAHTTAHLTPSEFLCTEVKRRRAPTPVAPTLISRPHAHPRRAPIPVTHPCSWCTHPYSSHAQTRRAHACSSAMHTRSAHAPSRTQTCRTQASSRTHLLPGRLPTRTLGCSRSSPGPALVQPWRATLHSPAASSARFWPLFVLALTSPSRYDVHSSCTLWIRLYFDPRCHLPLPLPSST
ncbi:hypothetical protein K438DRAFT_1997237 [Mycena galopus ATCC 62051]|nr:hypothetical protein K438DRAFT_1997237 [Mycena galopus ATCC 62051]